MPLNKRGCLRNIKRMLSMKSYHYEHQSDRVLCERQKQQSYQQFEIKVHENKTEFT